MLTTAHSGVDARNAKRREFGENVKTFETTLPCGVHLRGTVYTFDEGAKTTEGTIVIIATPGESDQIQNSIMLHPDGSATIAIRADGLPQLQEIIESLVPRPRKPLVQILEERINAYFNRTKE